MGFITRGHGISVHTKNCVNYQAALKRNDPAEMARWLPVQWTNNTSTLIPTSIEVIATDRVWDWYSKYYERFSRSPIF